VTGSFRLGFAFGGVHAGVFRKSGKERSYGRRSAEEIENKGRTFGAGSKRAKFGGAAWNKGGMGLIAERRTVEKEDD
jgi:hypothetical protein